MTAYKTLKTIFRKTTALILIGASIIGSLSAAAAENSYLSAEIYATATEVADRLNDELRLDLAETIQPPTALRVNLVAATGQTDDAVQENQLLSAHAANAFLENDS